MPTILGLSNKLKVQVPTVGRVPSSITFSQNNHCDGILLKVTDSDHGLELYRSGDYYESTNVTYKNNYYYQLLFIFPTRVYLTTINVHYYSDSVHGLPRLSQVLYLLYQMTLKSGMHQLTAIC